MKIVAVSDTHQAYLKNMPAGDILIHAGDFSLLPKNSYENRELMLSELSDLKNWFDSIRHLYKHTILVPGNHDWIFEVDYNFASKFMGETLVLNDSSVTLEGLKIWGTPINLEYRNWAFNRAAGEEILRHYNMIPKDTDILVTHGPPLKILDQAYPQKNSPHLGDQDLLSTVEGLKLKAHIFGHIHGSHGTLVRGETTYINASIMDEAYEPSFSPIIFEV
ncbi:metallophosphoesterase [Halobacteriovorax sp. HLS]|uniref:metallophosphoesterase family protein n=1 Tax=Halobacteriovorax sp. HLS TaxID=2234000 RepID=UPI000FDC1AEB|nr:metallophosphatase domain-containing protein [Halobacteriovorax sp. HLS]